MKLLIAVSTALLLFVGAPDAYDTESADVAQVPVIQLDEGQEVAGACEVTSASATGSSSSSAMYCEDDDCTEVFDCDGEETVCESIYCEDADGNNLRTCYENGEDDDDDDM